MSTKKTFLDIILSTRSDTIQWPLGMKKLILSNVRCISTEIKTGNITMCPKESNMSELSQK